MSSQREKCDVLILSVEAGTGHAQAARALADALAERGLISRIEDTFAYGPSWVFDTVIGVYLRLLEQAPSVYSYLYGLAEGPSAGRLGQRMLTVYLKTFLGRGLRDLIRQREPRCIVCTHPFPVGVLKDFREEGWLRASIAGVVTDFSIHPFWAFQGVDRYYVAAMPLVDQLKAYGIDPKMVQVTGIPIKEDFLQAAPMSRDEAEKALNIPASPKRILVMGGGLGLGPVAEWVSGLNRAPLEDLQIVVVAGKNEELEQRLRQVQEPPERLVVLGYTRQVALLMACSDLFITKPGGLSASEAMAMALPQILLPPLPGQEEVNLRFLVDHQVAWPADAGDKFIEQVSILLQDEQRLSACRESARRLGNLSAARKVADDIEKIINR
ncbi:glycosyltransferase [Heliobacillus mobilis]|uniref:Glycosyltransferase n=1 Tax=Heliobacterium mobile TaxID=28064 RepID=A0A6I3SCN6_HELMO|nr:glycosyltransferase [Heliobacterium mobile]MTV47839.1 glycosyltransferase [Heliobacterium mobile]